MTFAEQQWRSQALLGLSFYLLQSQNSLPNGPPNEILSVPSNPQPQGGGDDRVTENVTLNFSKMSLDYVPQDNKGAPGTAIPMTWDIAANSNN